MADLEILTTLMRPFLRKGQQEAFSVPGELGAESRVLCIDAGDLSDTLFHMPLLTAFKRRHPDAELDFLVPEPHLDLVVRTGLVRECLVYKSGQLSPWRPAYGSLLKRLGTGQYDVAVVMSFVPKPRLEMGALASGARMRMGPSHAGGWPAVNFEVRTRSDTGGYLGDRMALAAPFLGFDPAELRSRWPLPDEAVRRAAQQVHFHKPNPEEMLIGVDPGRTKGGQVFATENLLFLMRQLQSQFVCKVLPLGLPEDADHLNRFETGLSDVPIGLQRDTLLDVLVLLSQCDLFLAGNTDLFHFAVAMEVPTVGLFSASEAAYYVPGNRPQVRVLDVAEGEKVDIETLMEAVEAVSAGRTHTASTVITHPENHPSMAKARAVPPGDNVGDRSDEPHAPDA